MLVTFLSSGPECSRNFTAPRGVLVTPGFPDKYPNNLECTFMIFAPHMSQIVVDFDSFDMEPDTAPPAGRSVATIGWRSGTASLQGLQMDVSHPQRLLLLGKSLDVLETLDGCLSPTNASSSCKSLMF
ncbi:hypothetical protein WMY93_033688 [Mugilogobius chulae]|uniref:CUB domain-containing protein n=1 Tax=Mugilogobius chulae TaxID=88201 RepID=A0AAW0MKB6_9GOBI